MTTEAELRDRLARLAEHTAPPADPGLATRIAAHSRARRRQRVGLTALVAAAAAVVVAVPAVLSGTSTEPASRPAAPVGIAPVDVLAGPTRGSLAADTAFVEAVRQLPWTRPDRPAPLDDPSFPGIPNPPVETRWVVFAEDVPGARWALVAGENTARPAGEWAEPERQTDLGALSDTAVAWFVGPPGATPEQMVVQDVPRGVDPTRPVGYSDGDTGAVVVIAAPGDVVEVSERPEIAADATVTRTFARVEAPEGVAVLGLAPAEHGYGLALRYRVLRNGVEIVTTGPDGRSDPDDVAPDPTATLLWRPETPADHMVLSQMTAVLASTGLSAEQVQFTIRWLGDVPAPAPAPARTAVFTATLPSGAVWVGTSLGVDLGGGSVAGTTCGSALRPAGEGNRLVAAVCQVTGMTANSPTLPSLVVVGTAEASTVRLLDGEGFVLAEHRPIDGVAVLGAPDGLAAVETLDESGRVLDRTAPLGEILAGEL